MTTKTDLPPLLRWGRVVTLLGEHGIKEKQVRTLKASGTLAVHPTHQQLGNVRAFYSRDQIFRDILDPLA